jgi:hypothetical protein
MSVRIKNTLFILFIVILLLPVIQKNIQLIRIQPLDGAYLLPKKPAFHLDNWFTGEFQEKYNLYAQDYMGFRPWFIRLRNQLRYSVFGKICTDGIIVGKREVLYQKMYLDAYMGEDFVGNDTIKEKVRKLFFVQNELKKRGVDFIFLLAPGKVSIYPEFLPENITINKKRKSNYEGYVDEMGKYPINLIDMRRYFLKIKSQAPYLLFPKGGTHWSGYAATLVADSLAKYITTLTSIKLGAFHSEAGILTKDSLRFTDNDIGKALDLIWDIPSWPAYYPKIVFDKDSLGEKPDILFIGDSFTQSLYEFYPFFSLFGNNTKFWGYNYIVAWPDSVQKKYVLVKSLNLKKEVESKRIIVIVSTEPNLNNFGFGFVENVYALYNNDGKTDQ